VTLRHDPALPGRPAPTGPPVRGRLASALCAAVLLAPALTACGSGASISAASAHSTAPAAGASATPAAAQAGWVEEEVSFPVGGLTVYGTYRHPAHSPRRLPAALLIAGSGPTDRDGNTRLIQGRVDTLKMVAERLSADGVASLRYDKLGSGKTGLGPYAADPAAIGVGPFTDEAEAALAYLAARPGVDKKRLTVIGHSEGALFALLLATRKGHRAPHVHGVGLLEPLSRRYLDLLSAQIRAQIDAQRQAGKITAEQAAEVEQALAKAVKSLRTTGTLPPNLPGGLATVLSASRFLAEADRLDPAKLAARLKPHTPALVSCSDADVQVSCDDVEHLVKGLAKAKAATDLVRLTGVSHVLKQDPSRTAAHYGDPLPFSPQLEKALAAFFTRHH
jgi:acetyl esterase/lipase